jgi:hypothetical protein
VAGTASSLVAPSVRVTVSLEIFHLGITRKPQSIVVNHSERERDFPTALSSKLVRFWQTV